MRKFKRVLKSEKVLDGLIPLEAEFFVALPLKEVEVRLKALTEKLKRKKNLIPQPLGTATKANINGRMLRVQPEERETITKKIEYTRRKDNVFVSYIRDFYVYKKYLQKPLNIEISLIEKDGELLISSPKLKFDNSELNNFINKSAINIFLELFDSYEIYKDDYNPAIFIPKNTKQLNFEIIKPGELDENTIADLVEGFERQNGGSKSVAVKERIVYLNNLKPESVGKGVKGFNGYLAFVYPKANIVIAESLYSNNATYVLNMNNYEDLLQKDKQALIKNNLMKHRINHDNETLDRWKSTIMKIYNKNYKAA